MNLCILVAGRLNSGKGADLPEFPELFHRLFERSDPGKAIRLSYMAALDEELPKDVGAFDGYLITGSPFSVYEDFPWIRHLTAFIRSAFDAGLPLAGICFGHQMLAQALGGRVEKSARGWGVGVRRSSIVARQPWMDRTSPQTLDLIYLHRDQVIKLPPNALLLMEDAFCPFGGFSIQDSVFAVQGHPELTNEICESLIRQRADRIEPDRAQVALTSLHAPHHGNRVGKWIVNFFLKKK